MLCIFVCFLFWFLFSFHLHFILAITKDVNTKKSYNTQDLLQQSKFNCSIPLLSKRKNKVMCKASYICVHSLTCACWSIFKCPVTLIINPVPLLVCKEIDSYPSYSHNMTCYTWMPIVVCVCSSVESDSVFPNYWCECCQQPHWLKFWRGLFFWMKWEEGEGDLIRT